MKKILLKYRYGDTPWTWATLNEAKKVLLEVGFTKQEMNVALLILPPEKRQEYLDKVLERINAGVN